MKKYVIFSLLFFGSTKLLLSQPDPLCPNGSIISNMDYGMDLDCSSSTLLEELDGTIPMLNPNTHDFDVYYFAVYIIQNSNSYTNLKLQT